MAGYYRKFVIYFGALSKPLTNLLKKGVRYVWTSGHSASFQALQQALMTAPVLALPDFSKTFVIETMRLIRGLELCCNCWGLVPHRVAIVGEHNI